MSNRIEFGELRPGAVTVVGPFVVPGLEVERRLRVYLPRRYTEGATHPVLYMFDGQNVFDDEPSYAGGWHLHEAVERLPRRRPTPIVVGVDHGGVRRIDELSPFAGPRTAGLLDRLLDWLLGVVAPSVGARLRAGAGPAHAVIGGSSMGGLAALYAHVRHPDVFGGAMAMSPALWVAGERLFELVARWPLPAVSRVYLDCGAREGRGAMLRQAARMADLLTARGYGPDRLMWRPDPRGAHNERNWRRRFPKAARFLFS